MPVAEYNKIAWESLSFPNKVKKFIRERNEAIDKNSELVKDYNGLVGKYNDLRGKHGELIEKYNEVVKKHNEILGKYKENLKQYNSLLAIIENIGEEGLVEELTGILTYLVEERKSMKKLLAYSYQIILGLQGVPDKLMEEFDDVCGELECEDYIYE